MGENKAWIPFLGIPLIERVVNRLHRVAAEVLIVTGNPDEIQQNNWNAIKDKIPGKGPLVGLYSAILEAQYPLIALVACDMPFVNPGLIFMDAQPKYKFHLRCHHSRVPYWFRAASRGL